MSKSSVGSMMNAFVSGHWEFNGEKRELPKHLVFSKNGGFDKRFKRNKEFLADPRWKYIPSFYERKMIENLLAELICIRQHKQTPHQRN